MPISFNCAVCQKRLKADDGAVGKRVRCSGCGTVQVVARPRPAAGAARRPAPPPEPPSALVHESTPAATPPARPRPARRLWLLWAGLGLLAALLAVGTLGVVAIWLLWPTTVWVGDVQGEAVDDNGGFVPHASYSRGENGGLWITVYDLDGNSVGALVTDKGRDQAVEDELKEAAQDVPTAATKVSAGWIPRGCSAAKAVTRFGLGVEAANYKFSPNAVQMVVNQETIKNAASHGR